MPTLALPNDPNLDHLRNQAKKLLSRIRAGDPESLEVVREFHPRDAVDGFTLADAQLVIARQYGFPSWPKLHQHVEAVNHYTRSPHRQPVSGSSPDDFLRLACLNYGADSADRRTEARLFLGTHPEVAHASIHTIAAVGDVEAASELLARNPSLARAEGGPFRWEPMLYVAYSRLDSTEPGHSTYEVAKLLLEHGADPNAGFLWEGLPSPFTALTGAFGRGEGNQPPHQYRLELARLLLDAGADPNDSQVMYNLGLGCWPVSDDSHLELLFEYGLGRGDGGPWRERIGIAMLSPEELVHEELMYAASQNLPDRARLILEHGVDVNRRSTGHPAYGQATPLELAVAHGNSEIVELLGAAGAEPVTDPIAVFMGACLRADDEQARAMLRAEPDLLGQTVARVPDLMTRAVERGRPAAIRLLVSLGLDVNDTGCWGSRTPLHSAALNGDRDVVLTLLELGADPTAVDGEHHSTPQGWAEYAGHTEIAALLAPHG